jgi:hypothetical protein
MGVLGERETETATLDKAGTTLPFVAFWRASENAPRVEGLVDGVFTPLA